ncbi:hypothetical protein VNO78_10095 [Psophocarpus tetragonolobus]|uniref:LysM domain-containing protein n=1 Tax=Psophocarpus tetragonolobus TaxID=3891 RepID=A0AAN9XM88_PSOTE
MRVWGEMLCLVLGLVLVTRSVVEAKWSIEACNSSESEACPSLLSYILPWDSKVSEIATRFGVNVNDILASNAVFPITAWSGQKILRKQSEVRIPISCCCVDGIRRSVSTIYTVSAADTFASISEGYGGLVTAQQIKILNGIDALTYGATILIPLPCTCFNNLNNAATAIYITYVVQRRDTLESIATKFGTTLSDLQTVNGFGEPTVHPGDILSVPLPACSSAAFNWYHDAIILPNASYTLTAANCIKCTCQPTDFTLQCVPSGLDVPCYNLRCKGSHLIIGDQCVDHSETACNVTQCVYRGHRGGKILSSVKNSSYLRCPDNLYHSGASCSPYPEDLFGMSPRSSPLPLPVSKASPSTLASSGRLDQFLILVLQLFFLKLILRFLI